MTVLSESTIKLRGLVSDTEGGYAVAYQPAGVDLRVLTVSRYRGAGRLRADSSKKLPETTMIPPIVLFESSKEPYWYLEQGSYLCGVYETTHIPTDCIAYLYSRSSLCRSGCYLETAVFDPGYEGRPGVMLVVQNEAGLYLEQGTPIGQLVFHTLDQETRAYSGSYQFEGVKEIFP